MKLPLLAGAFALALCAAACTSTGALAPAAQSDVTTALAVACPVAAALNGKIPSDTNSQAAYSLLASLCPPNAPPTNAVVAALDILNAYEVLKPLVKGEMAAPVIVALVAFLGGWQGAPAVIETIGGASRVASLVDGAVVDLDRLCQATDPLIDALGDARPKSRALAALAAAADRICVAAADGPGITTDAKLVGAVLTAIEAARLSFAAPASARIANVASPRGTGR